MILIIDKRTGLVSMRCEGRPTVDERKFDIIEIEPTEEERKSLERNDTLGMEDGKLILVEKRQQLQSPMDIEKLTSVKEDLAQGKIDAAEAIKKILDAICT